MITTIKSLQQRQAQLNQDIETFIRTTLRAQPDNEVSFEVSPEDDEDDVSSYPVVTTLRDDGCDMTLGITSVYLGHRNEIAIYGYDMDNLEEKGCDTIYPATYPDILEFLQKVLALE